MKTHKQLSGYADQKVTDDSQGSLQAWFWICLAERLISVLLKSKRILSKQITQWLA